MDNITSFTIVSAIIGGMVLYALFIAFIQIIGFLGYWLLFNKMNIFLRLLICFVIYLIQSIIILPTGTVVSRTDTSFPLRLFLYSIIAVPPYILYIFQPNKNSVNGNAGKSINNKYSPINRQANKK